MKLLILSDLHLEFAPFSPPRDLMFDVVVLAGDIHTPGRRVIEWARRESTFGSDTPILFVPGNHEFYGAVMDNEMQLMRDASAGTNFHVLHEDAITFGGVRFVGVVLWTDFQTPLRDVRVHGSVVTSDVATALSVANRGLNDFRLIQVPVGRTPALNAKSGRNATRLLTAEDTLKMHQSQRQWLHQKLCEPFDGPTVVITHHAPAAGSIHPQYSGDGLTPAFVSDLPRPFFDKPAAPVLWIHGHTHNSADYQNGACRVIANPRGYPRGREGAFENPEFQPGLLVEVSAGGGVNVFEPDAVLGDDGTVRRGA